MKIYVYPAAFTNAPITVEGWQTQQAPAPRGPLMSSVITTHLSGEEYNMRDLRVPGKAAPSPSHSP